MTEQRTHQERDALAVFRRTQDPEDFGVLVELAYDRVLTVADRILLNAHDSRDVAQEAFVTAHAKFAGFRGASSFATWVCAIAVRKALSLARRRRPTVSVDETAEPSTGPEQRPDRQLMQAERMHEFDRAMAALAPELRAALTLTVVDELSGAEAARACGCTRATLYWRIHHARRQLRTRIAQQEQQP